VVRDTWLVFQGPLGCRLRHLHTQVGEKGNGGKEKTAGVGKGDSHDTWHNVHIRKESADGRGREGLAQGQGGEWHHVGLWKLCPGEVCDKKKKMRGGGALSSPTLLHPVPPARLRRKGIDINLRVLASLGAHGLQGSKCEGEGSEGQHRAGNSHLKKSREKKQEPHQRVSGGPSFSVLLTQFHCGINLVLNHQMY
jgi:hypothetical protein